MLIRERQLAEFFPSKRDIFAMHVASDEQQLVEKPVAMRRQESRKSGLSKSSLCERAAITNTGPFRHASDGHALHNSRPSSQRLRRQAVLWDVGEHRKEGCLPRDVMSRAAAKRRTRAS